MIMFVDKTYFMKQILTFISLFICFSNTVFPQDTLLLMNGDKIILNEYSLAEGELFLNYKNEKGRTKTVDSDYIFSITDKNGSTKIFYSPDSSSENSSLSIEQMANFVKGQSFAKDNYKANLFTYGGAIAGFGGATMGVYILPLMYAPIFPAANSAVIGLTQASKKKFSKKYPQYADNEYFIYGYQERSKVKRTKNSIIGGIGGLIAGVIAVSLISSAN